MDPTPEDYDTAKRLYAHTFAYDGWCQLCGAHVAAGVFAWELPPRRRGKSRRALVCSDCFWQRGIPSADSVHHKIRFRLAHHKPASLSWAELRTAVDALDAVQAGGADRQLEDLLSKLDERLRDNKTNMTSAEVTRLADALFELESVQISDPYAIASPLWEL